MDFDLDGYGLHKIELQTHFWLIDKLKGPKQTKLKIKNKLYENKADTLVEKSNKVSTLIPYSSGASHITSKQSEFTFSR